MAETTHTEAHSQGHGHHDPKEHEKHYWRIYWILVVLLVVSVIGPFVGEAVDVFAITLLTAFGIAVVKAALVVKNFMHLNMEPKYVAYLCATALALMALLFFWVAPDVMKHEGHQWVNVSAMAAAGQTPSGEAGAEEFDPAGIYQSTCSSCHGAEGAGDGVAAAGLDPQPANFTETEFWTNRDRDRIETAIAQGGPAVGASPLMAAFGAGWTEAQMDAFVDWMETEFRPEGAGEEPAPEEPAEPVAEGEPPAEGEPAAEGEPPAEGEALAEGEPPAEGEEPAEGEPLAEGELPAEPVPAEPTGPSEAELEARSAFITERLYR